MHISDKESAKQQAIQWLAQQNCYPFEISTLGGYTNYVFLIQCKQKGFPAKSVLRLARQTANCLLNTHFAATVSKHQWANELGIAPTIIHSDEINKAMWLTYAGEPKALQPHKDQLLITQQLQDIHTAPIPTNGYWQNTGYNSPLDTLNTLVTQNTSSKNHQSTQALLEKLLCYADYRDYQQLQCIPTHNDLNPGNWLYHPEQKRWWIIDWDYAGLNFKEWDYASLIVEHHWQLEQACVLFPKTNAQDLIWFCSCFALLSFLWHQNNQSPEETIVQKQVIVNYWSEQLKY